MTGVRWYVGVPRAGKTTLAAQHAAELSRLTGWPVLVIDSAGAAQLGGVPRARNLADAIEHVWQRRTHAAFTPDDAAEVDAAARAVLAAGRVVLLVDEAAFWINSRNANGPLLRIMRAHRHAKVWALLTTQHLSADVPQSALSCAPELYVFRCTSPAVLDRLEREYGLERNRVANLGIGRYLRVETGFPT